MGELSVTLSGLTLDNPLIPASGTFGYGFDHADFFDVNEVGSFSIKGTTLHPRSGTKNSFFSAGGSARRRSSSLPGRRLSAALS